MITDRNGDPMRMVDTDYWINAHERPGWFSDLERALMDARPRIVDCTGAHKPHPQDVALVVSKWLRDRGVNPT